MLKVPKKGSTEWRSLASIFEANAGDLDEEGRAKIEALKAQVEGAEFGILHKGRGSAVDFSFRMRALRNAETQRLFDMRKKYTEAQAPELWKYDFASEEFQREFYKLSVEIVRAYINGVRGIEGYDSSYIPESGTELPKEKRDEIVDLIEQLGLVMDLQSAVLGAQGLSLKEVLS